MTTEIPPPNSSQARSAMCYALQNRGLAALVTLFVLAALVFASFPALAAADSSGVQYENAVPSATGTSPIPSHPGPVAHSSTAPGATPVPGETSDATPGSATPSRMARRASHSGLPSSFSGTRPTAGVGGQRNPGKGMGSDQRSHHEQMNRALGTTQPTSGGGFSPLGLILLLAFALAAISIGVVFLRQRRQASGSPSLPKAS
jgi:hypothetical protein